jgi:hypothetical protein
MEVPRNLGFQTALWRFALAHSHRKAIFVAGAGTSSAEVRRAAAFRVALRKFVRESEHAARKARLTPQRYVLLLLVKGAEDGTERATISELCKRLHLAQSTVTELVNRAAQVGLVRRRASATD